VSLQSQQYGDCRDMSVGANTTLDWGQYIQLEETFTHNGILPLGSTFVMNGWTAAQTISGTAVTTALTTLWF
jgi:hypothetical protein